MENKFCSNCGQPVGQNSAFCDNCGRQILSMKYCSNCGAVMDANQEVCGNCGNGWNVRPNSYNAAHQENTAGNSGANNPGGVPGGSGYNAPSGYQGDVHNHYYQNNTRPARNKWIAFLLLIFCGALGVHKFYEGKVAMGIVYIFTVGFFGIGLFVDFFVILCKPAYY